MMEPGPGVAAQVAPRCAGVLSVHWRQLDVPPVGELGPYEPRERTGWPIAVFLESERNTMEVFVFGHGNEGEEDTFIPHGLNVQFFALPGQVLRGDEIAAFFVKKNWHPRPGDRFKATTEGVPQIVDNRRYAPTQGWEREVIRASYKEYGQFLFVGDSPLGKVRNLCSSPKECREYGFMYRDGGATEPRGNHREECAGLFSPTLVREYYNGTLNLVACAGTVKNFEYREPVLNSGELRLISHIVDLLSRGRNNDAELAWSELSHDEQAIAIGAYKDIAKWRHRKESKKSSSSLVTAPTDITSVITETFKSLGRIAKQFPFEEVKSSAKPKDGAEDGGREPSGLAELQGRARNQVGKACEEAAWNCDVLVATVKRSGEAAAFEMLPVLKDALLILVEASDLFIKECVRQKLETELAREKAAWETAKEAANRTLSNERFQWVETRARLKEFGKFSK